MRLSRKNINQNVIKGLFAFVYEITTKADGPP